MNPFHIKIVVNYFEKKEDFLNLMLSNKKYEDLNKFYSNHIYPHFDSILFENKYIPKK